MFDLIPVEMSFQQAFPVATRELLLRIRAEFQLDMTQEDIALLRRQRQVRQAAEAAKRDEQKN